MFQKNDENKNLFHEYSTDSANNDEPTFTQITAHNYIQLVKGDISYNNGNYVMYVGSESCPQCNNLLYTERVIDKDNKNLLLKSSEWNKAYKYSQKDSNLGTNKPKFIMYSDKLDDLDESQKTLPWRRHAKDDWEKGHIKDDYVRYDESAVNFRKIQEQLHNHIGRDKTSSIPTVILYKKGKPIVLGYDKFEEIEEKNKLWNLAQKDKSEDQKTKRVENELIEYMLYYYKKEAKLI